MAAGAALHASMASSEMARRSALARTASAPVLVAPALTLYGLFTLWPSLDIFWLALQRWNGYGRQRFVGLANLKTLWHDQLFRTSLLHSALWLAGAIVITPTIGLLVALAARRTPGQSPALAILFFPALLPSTVVATVAILVYSPLSGLLNSALQAVGLGRFAADWLGDPHLALGALFAAWLWSTVGIAVAVMWAALSAIGPEYVELAEIEGAGSVWRLRHVTLPGIQRALILVTVIAASLASQAFDLVFVTTGGGPGYATMLLPLDMYGRAFGGRAGQGAAVACVQVLMTLAALVPLLAGWGRAPSLDSGDTVRRARQPSGLAAAVVGMAAIGALLPLAWLPIAALQPARSFALTGPSLNPATWTLSTIVDAWNLGLPSALATSTEIAAAATFLTLLLICPAAFALSRPSRWRVPVLAVMVFGLLQPPVLTLIPLFSLLKSLDLLNTMWGVLLPEVAQAIPFAVLAVWSYMAGSPRDVLEAAAVDGASPLRQLLAVALPLARPALIVAAIWTFVSSWNNYLLPTIVSQDGSITTVPTVLASFAGTLDTRFGTLAAGAILGLAPSLLIYLTLRRVAVTGLESVRRTAP